MSPHRGLCNVDKLLTKEFQPHRDLDSVIWLIEFENTQDQDYDE